MDYVAMARTVIGLEIEELSRLQERIDGSFTRTVEVLRSVIESQRKIIVCGVGKSGNIARKIAATLTSTGASAVALHTQDALHGDLGLVNEGDAVILLSYSGETDEVVNLLPHLKRAGVRLIAVTGNTNSTLARHADLTLDVRVQREACPMNLAPTSSSTVMLVLGDALAMVLLEARGFEAEDFAKFHPGGSLGRALLMKISDIMRHSDRLAICPDTAPVLAALQTMSRSKAGAAILVDGDGRLSGIFTQGDFVRAFQRHADVSGRGVAEFMSRNPVTIRADRLAGELLQVLEHHNVDEVVVLSEDGKPVGVVDTQDLSKVKLL